VLPLAGRRRGADVLLLLPPRLPARLFLLRLLWRSLLSGRLVVARWGGEGLRCRPLRRRRLLRTLPVLGRRPALHDLEGLPVALLPVARQGRLVRLLLPWWGWEAQGRRSVRHSHASRRRRRAQQSAAGAWRAGQQRTVLKVMKAMPRKRPVSGKVIMSRLSISPQ
jgi:hypothetical protein